MGSSFSQPTPLGSKAAESSEVVKTPSPSPFVMKTTPPDPREVRLAELERRVAAVEVSIKEAAAHRVSDLAHAEDYAQATHAHFDTRLRSVEALVKTPAQPVNVKRR